MITIKQLPSLLLDSNGTVFNRADGLMLDQQHEQVSGNYSYLLETNEVVKLAKGDIKLKRRFSNDQIKALYERYSSEPELETATSKKTIVSETVSPDETENTIILDGVSYINIKQAISETGFSRATIYRKIKSQ